MKRFMALAMLLPLCGCSFFAGSNQNLTILSHDEADLYVDGLKVGKGRVVVPIKRDKSHIVEARLDGQTAMLGVGTRLGTTGVLDIIGGFVWLVPFLGLTAPGAYTLDTDVVSLHLERK